MPWINPRSPEPVERIISALCYLSFGLIGLLYIIVNGKSSRDPFFRFHFMQAIVLGIIGVLLSWTANSVAYILSGILGLFGAAGASGNLALFPVIGSVMDVLSKVGILLNLYALIWALLGKYAEIPFLSNLVRQQIR